MEKLVQHLHHSLKQKTKVKDKKILFLEPFCWPLLYLNRGGRHHNMRITNCIFSVSQGAYRPDQSSSTTGSSPRHSRTTSSSPTTSSPSCQIKWTITPTRCCSHDTQPLRTQRAVELITKSREVIWGRNCPSDRRRRPAFLVHHQPRYQEVFLPY